jgi:small subunit ribosomal protein S16
MPVKIRLARHGRKRYAYYHIVVADSRAPRDGRYIERIGSYNPNTNPATIDLNMDKALTWLSNGAQPTDTARAILSYKGVLMKKHLLEGVKKGAFDEAEAERRFDKWLLDKDSKVQAKKDLLAGVKAMTAKERLEEEAKINAERAAAIAKKNTPPPPPAPAVVEEVEAPEAPKAVADVVEEVADAPEAVSDVAEEATEESAPEEPKAE